MSRRLFPVVVAALLLAALTVGPATVQANDNEVVINPWWDNRCYEVD